MKPEYLELVTEDRLILPGLLFEPPRKTTRALIYLHGNGSSSVFYSGKRLTEQARELGENGIAYLAFNNRGSGYLTKVRRTDGGKVMAGTACEKIADCVKDIDAAAIFLKRRGYQKLGLIGFSTGANKACVYSYRKRRNPISRYILACGGDDVGSYYRALGNRKFWETLRRAKRETLRGNGSSLVPTGLVPIPYSWQGLYDILNPDGDYNTFPFLEAFRRVKLSTKPLFRHFRSLAKPTLVIYGERDEFTSGPARLAVELLKSHASTPELVDYAIIPGADHGLTGKERLVSKITARWLEDW